MKDIANWWERFFAWIIDFIIVGIVAGIFFWPVYMGSPFVDWGYIFGVPSVLLFLYWTILEGYNGQSIGKMVVNIKMTGKKGEKIDVIRAAISSFGKAFLLPLDVIIGVIARPGENVRVFNIVSNTKIIKVRSRPARRIKSRRIKRVKKRKKRR